MLNAGLSREYCAEAAKAAPDVDRLSNAAARTIQILRLEAKVQQLQAKDQVSALQLQAIDQQLQAEHQILTLQLQAKDLEHELQNVFTQHMLASALLHMRGLIGAWCATVQGTCICSASESWRRFLPSCSLLCCLPSG